MPKIVPFRATLPTKDKVALVTCRSYETYTVAELASQLDFNPYSFLHVVNPFYVNQQKMDEHTRFHQVNSKYNQFKTEKTLHKDTTEGLYLLKIISKKETFIGIIGGLEVADYLQNKIKKHEDTFEYRVDLFKDYMKYAGFYTEPILITYPDSEELNQWIKKQTQKPAHFEFATNKKEIHNLWKIKNPEDIAFVQQVFAQMDCLYIADGHHRTASATKLHQETGNSPYFMSYLIAESNLKINEYNRVIKDLNGHSKKQFLKLLGAHFIIENKNQTIYTPEEKFNFGMYLDGDFYRLQLKDNKVDKSDILQSLDTQILYDFVLNPLLDIGDLRTDQRIEYLSGQQSVIELKNKVDNQDFEVAFLMYKTSISEIKTIADKGLIMPPKSTYIEPKFRVGLTIFEVDL